MITPGRVGQLVTAWILLSIVFYALYHGAEWLAEWLHIQATKNPAAHANETTGLNNDSET